MDYPSQWLLPPNQQPSSSHQSSIQSLQDQISRLSILPSSDPSSVVYPTVVPRPPTLTPATIDHHRRLEEEFLLNQLRSFSAAQVHDIQNMPNSGLGLGLGSGFASPSSYVTPHIPRVATSIPSGFINTNTTDHRFNDLNDHYIVDDNELLLRLYNRNLMMNIINNTYNSNNGGGNDHRRCRHRRTTTNDVRTCNNDKQAIVSALLSSCDRMRGKVVGIVIDKDSSHLLLKKFETGQMECIKLVVSEIKENIVEVLRDFDGSHFFQRFLKYLDFDDVHELLKAILANMHICFDHHGTRAAQEIVKHVDKNDREVKRMIVQAIKQILSDIKKSQLQNGYHFVDAVLKAFHGVSDVVKPLMNEVAKFSVDISMDRVGCCKLQDIIRSGVEPERSHIIDAIITNACELSYNDYGNFVVQCAITLKGEQHLTAQVIKVLEGYFVDLSKSKGGSHVVQKCLTSADPEFAELVMNEICHPSVFLELCQHPYGNFVIQTALEVAEMTRVTSRSSMYQLMVKQIQDNHAFLHSHMYGKRVLIKLNKLQKPCGF